MGDERGPSALLVVGGLVAALALGGGTWYLLSNRGASDVDSGGFDLSAAPKTVRPVAAAPAPEAPAAPRSGLEMLTVDERTKAEVNAARPAPAAEPGTPAAPAARSVARDPAQARADFVAQARKHEVSVRDFAARMTAKSPVVAQYGRDWMSHDDLKKLNDDYMRTHDPVAFMAGLAKAPSFPVLLKKYAGSPELAGVVVLGITKEAPGELIDAGLAWARTDPNIKDTVSKIASALGLPPDMIKKLTAAEAAAEAPRGQK